MAKQPEWSVLIRCTHKKHFWIPIAVFLDPQVTSYGCGCPEGGPSLPTPKTPASNRAINRAVRKLRREMRKL
jgi:hypothetical protein